MRKPRAPAHRRADREQALAKEGEFDRESCRRRGRTVTDPGYPWRPRAPAPGLAFGYRPRLRGQPANAVGDPGGVGDDAHRDRLAEQLETG